MYSNIRNAGVNNVKSYILSKFFIWGRKHSSIVFFYEICFWASGTLSPKSQIFGREIPYRPNAKYLGDG